MSDRSMQWGKIKEEMLLDVLGEVDELIIQSIAIDKPVFERSPEGGEEAYHAGV